MNITQNNITFEKCLKEIPTKAYGFIYRVSEISTRRYYIGKKDFYSKIKGIKQESNWRYYTTSCKELSSKIKKNIDDYEFKILKIAFDSTALKFAEIEEMINHKCITSELSYNNNIQIMMMCKIKDYGARVITL